MENGISGHYYYSKKLRYWAVVDGEEKGFVEAELPEKREYPPTSFLRDS
jgi:hypothetical protein